MSGTRAAEIMASVRQQLEAHGAALDAADDLREVVVTVKLRPGAATVKATIVRVRIGYDWETLIMVRP